MDQQCDPPLNQDKEKAGLLSMQVGPPRKPSPPGPATNGQQANTPFNWRNLDNLRQSMHQILAEVNTQIKQAAEDMQKGGLVPSFDAESFTTGVAVGMGGMGVDASVAKDTSTDSIQTTPSTEPVPATENSQSGDSNQEAPTPVPTSSKKKSKWGKFSRSSKSSSKHDTEEAPAPTPAALSSAPSLPTKPKHIPKLSEPSNVLTQAQFAEIIHLGAPHRFKISNVKLVYSTMRDGISLQTFYRLAGKHQPTILAIRDGTGGSFGCYASAPWKSLSSGADKTAASTGAVTTTGMKYYGTGECFLYRVNEIKADGEGRQADAVPVSSDTAKKLDSSGDSTTQIGSEVTIYKWVRGQNTYFQLSSDQFLAMGGGADGGFGIFIDSEFNRGTSVDCPTFGSRGLSKTQQFQCVVLELWALVP